jgi:hypothetical protein
MYGVMMNFIEIPSGYPDEFVQVHQDARVGRRRLYGVINAASTAFGQDPPTLVQKSDVPLMVVQVA